MLFRQRLFYESVRVKMTISAVLRVVMVLFWFFEILAVFREGRSK